GDNYLDARRFPMIIKPVRPLGGFKTFLPTNADELLRWTDIHQPDLPFMAQRFIPGDDRAIYFSALYLDAGKVLARFDGHKLRSRPLGHTTIAESFRNEEVYRQTGARQGSCRLSHAANG
ncbi:MAG: hypothetical protein IPN75_09040, partial [Dechloromonas sp.]|nr:hypothetical protein [Candidatus Dechloromonas phosphorivorans]